MADKDNKEGAEKKPHPSKASRIHTGLSHKEQQEQNRLTEEARKEREKHRPTAGLSHGSFSLSDVLVMIGSYTMIDCPPVAVPQKGWVENFKSSFFPGLKKRKQTKKLNAALPIPKKKQGTEFCFTQQEAVVEHFCANMRDVITKPLTPELVIYALTQVSRDHDPYFKVGPDKKPVIKTVVSEYMNDIYRHSREWVRCIKGNSASITSDFDDKKLRLHQLAQGGREFVELVQDGVNQFCADNHNVVFGPQ